MAQRTVTIETLEKKYKVEGRTVRRLIRLLDIHAPLVEGKGLYYSWTAGDAQLKRIETMLKTRMDGNSPTV